MADWTSQMAGKLKAKPRHTPGTVRAARALTPNNLVVIYQLITCLPI